MALAQVQIEPDVSLDWRGALQLVATKAGEAMRRPGGGLPPLLTADAADWKYYSLTLSLRDALEALAPHSLFPRMLRAKSDRFDLDWQKPLLSLRVEIRDVARLFATLRYSNRNRGEPIVIFGCCEGTPTMFERGLISDVETNLIGDARVTRLSLARSGRVITPDDDTFTRVGFPDPKFAADLLRNGVPAWLRHQRFEQLVGGRRSIGDSMNLFTGTDQSHEDGWSPLHRDARNIHKVTDPVSGRAGFGSWSPALFATLVYPDDASNEWYFQILKPIHDKRGWEIGSYRTMFSAFGHDAPAKPWMNAPCVWSQKNVRQLLPSGTVSTDPSPTVELDPGRPRLLRNAESDGSPTEGAQEQGVLAANLVTTSAPGASHRIHNIIIDDKPSDVVLGRMEENEPGFEPEEPPSVAARTTVIDELQMLKQDLLRVHDAYAEELQDILDRYAGARLNDDDVAEFRTLANELMGRLDRYVQLESGEPARLQTRPDRHGHLCLRFQRASGGTRRSGAPPQTIPGQLNLMM